MRKIGTLRDPHQGVAFGRLLNKNEIKNQIEVIRVDDPIDPNKQRYDCVIWIHDEDQVEKAEFLLDQFQLEDHDYLNEDYTPTKDEDEEGVKKPIENYPVSLFFTVLCVVIFLLTEMTTPVVPKNEENVLLTVPLTSSPIKKSLLYDWPLAFARVDQVVDQYGIDKVANLDIPESGKKELVNAIHHTPVWYGIYPYLLNKFSKNPEAVEIDSDTLFYSIRHGEVWRLFTPALLHYDLFHIFFNMLWLIFLGRMLEKILNKKQYLLLILLAGLASNTAQYLMTGPNFMGYSGILTAYFAFIWMRQRIAPWEAYPLHPSVITFITIFVFGMFILSFLSFFTEILWDFSFAPGVANTAHVVGALTGAFLARFRYFSKGRA